MSVETLFTAYESTILSIGILAALMFIQLLIADIVGLFGGHKPGSGVEVDHGVLHFRAVRTVANTNESIGIFILLVLFAIGVNASAELTAYAAWAFVGARTLYAVCYYTNQQILRSVCFAFSLLALIAIFVIALMAL